MKIFIKNCIVCGKQFSYQKYVSQEKIKPRVCCSIECRYKLASQKLSGGKKNRPKDQSKQTLYTCAECGKGFEGYTSSKRKFCSKECRKSGIKIFTKKCVVCGKQFSYQKYVSQEKIKPRLCCSKKCQYDLTSQKLNTRFFPNQYNQKQESKWRVNICKQCGKTFEALISTKRSFCSPKCKAEWQKDNLRGKANPNWKPLDLRKPYQTVSHKVRKDLIAERKNCERCGTKKNLQVHHRDRNRGNNLPRNMLLLCKSCHADLHKREGNPEIAELIMRHPTQKQ